MLAAAPVALLRALCETDQPTLDIVNAHFAAPAVLARARTRRQQEWLQKKRKTVFAAAAGVVSGGAGGAKKDLRSGAAAPGAALLHLQVGLC